MHKLIIKLFFFLIVFQPALIIAQVQNPVQWTFSSVKKGVNSYEIHCVARIEKGWHLYSQTTPKGGPIPTHISFGKNPLISETGTVKEIGKMETHKEPLFGVEVRQFSDLIDFVQTVTLKSPVKTNVNGTVEYMLCDNKQCLPPARVAFSVTLN